MGFKFSEKSITIQKELSDFMIKNIYPEEENVLNFQKSNLWSNYPKIETLKLKAKEQGLWNLFLPKDYNEFSPGLSNLDYAPLAEIMGRVPFSSEVFNCSAPDTGNMEVLAKYGSQDQKKTWLKPLLDGEIRSAFLMTEPDVASSDATNIQTSIEKKGDHYLINGKKWWSSGAMNPKCKFFIVMGKSDKTAERHKQQSMIIVPANNPGVKILRPLSVFGYMDSPHGHAEIELKNVKVPNQNLILGQGRGFEIAQGRLGPGRIHHCMRLIGAAQRTLEMMCKRVNEREAFGKKLKDYSSIRQDIAKSASEIEQARLLTFSAADNIDKNGIKGAKELIAMIKIIIPKMTCDIIDRAIQAYGGKGLSDDIPLAQFYMYARTIRLADGPDEVHMYQLGRNIIKKYL
tara:strand:- start:5584 stop:6789 length:1206 start_codon:yes stop_codon:yes gene_type:complete